MLVCFFHVGALIERHLTDPRTGRNRQFPVPDLFRQSIYSRLAGYEDTNDAERLPEDPAFRMWLGLYTSQNEDAGSDVVRSETWSTLACRKRLR